MDKMLGCVLLQAQCLLKNQSTLQNQIQVIVDVIVQGTINKLLSVRHKHHQANLCQKSKPTRCIVNQCKIYMQLPVLTAEGWLCKMGDMLQVRKLWSIVRMKRFWDNACRTAVSDSVAFGRNEKGKLASLTSLCNKQQRRCSLHAQPWWVVKIAVLHAHVSLLTHYWCDVTRPALCPVTVP